MIELSKIRTDGGTQSRAAIHEETVADYAEAMGDENTVFPPCVVYHDGKDYWLADGFHRVEAWRRVGRVEVPAEVRQGDRRKAVLHSCAANAAHGLRRTNADKRRAVMTLLEDDEWSQWSNREIARQCRVDDKTVANYRADVTAEFRSEGQPRTYTTKHGTEAQMDTSRIGAGSKPDQEPADAEYRQENKAETPPDQGKGALAAAPDQKADDLPPTSDPEPTPDPYGYKKLTEDALLDLANGLRADLEDEKVKRKAAQAEVKALKEKLADLTDDDKNEVIRRLQADVKNAGNAKWKALEDRDAYLRQVHALKKRLAELEREEVPLN